MVYNQNPMPNLTQQYYAQQYNNLLNQQNIGNNGNNGNINNGNMVNYSPASQNYSQNQQQYVPTNYNPYLQNLQNYNPQNYNQNNNVSSNTQNNNQVWVQGEAGAKAYPVVAGNSIMLMDSEDSVFYIKTTDVNGVPLPLRTFDYVERTTQNNNNNNILNNANTNNVNNENKSANTVQTDVCDSVNLNNYITREEFEQRLAELSSLRESLKNASNNTFNDKRGVNNESIVQSSKRRSEPTANKQFNKHNEAV